MASPAKVCRDESNNGTYRKSIDMRRGIRTSIPCVTLPFHPRSLLIHAIPTRFQALLSVLAKEESLLQSQLGKVRDAIAALGGVGKEYQRRQRVRKVKTVARRVVKMTAAQRKAVSVRMKKYWAARTKAKG